MLELKKNENEVFTLTSVRKKEKIIIYYVNTNEIPVELSRENLIYSR